MLAQALTIAMLLTGFGTTSPCLNEGVKLNHTFSVDQADTFQLKGKLEGAADIEFKGDLAFKVTKVSDDGTADGQLAMSHVQILMNGTEAPDAGEQVPLDTKIDQHGMPSTLDVNGLGFMYVLFAASNYLPASEVEQDAPFDVNWSDDTKTSTLKGSGKLIEVAEQDGKKVAVIKSSLELVPNGQAPGQIEVTCRFWLDTGRLIKSEGTVTIEDGTLSFSLEAKEDSK